MATATRKLGVSPLAKIERMLSAARRSMKDNIRTRGAMASPPTFNGATAGIPSGLVAGGSIFSNPERFDVQGGQISVSNGRVKSAVIATTGGNLGTNDGAYGTYSRVGFWLDDITFAARVYPTSERYRLIVDGQYADATGVLTSQSTGVVHEYLQWTFATRAMRYIEIEMQKTCGFIGLYRGATGFNWKPPAAERFRSVLLLDSYAEGAGATALGDGLGAVMADYLGTRHSNSGSPGTGWANTGATYRFHERIANGDLSLGGTPDVIATGGSYNDRGRTGFDGTPVQANCLTGLQSARALHPGVPIIVFGVWPARSGPGQIGNTSADIITPENAVQAAVAAFADPLTRFISVSTIPVISGTGRVGATTGTGNSDLYTSSDDIHPPTAGHAFIGKWMADKVADALADILAAA